MPPRVLYQRLCQQLRACAPQFGVWHRQRLALLVTGLLLARHTALPRLAAQLRRVTPTAQADSIERRLRRTLADATFETSVFAHLARTSLRELPAGRCLLLLDDTQQTTRCILSTLALAYAGRALPLAWRRWSGRLHGGYWKQIDQLFDEAARLLPPQVQPVVVADRGVASPMLIRLVQQHGWDYLLRVTNDTTLLHPEQAPQDAVHLGELLDQPRGVVVRLTGQLFRKHRVSEHAVAIWQAGVAPPLRVETAVPGRSAGVRARRERRSLVFQLRPGAYNGETLIEFLSDLHQLEPGRRMVLLWDGLPAHRSRCMTD
jgi:hypothetical protein